MSANPDNGSTRDSRFAAGLPARARIAGKSYPCTAHNLSRTGALLVGCFPVETGATLEILLNSPHGDLEVSLRGRVARFETGAGEDESRLAIEFFDVDAEHKDAFEILLSRVIEGQVPAPLEGLRPGAPPPDVRKALEQIPLAHRIALAARATPKEREFLRQDTHPQVLEALARNPNLLQAEARALASANHLLPRTLEILANDPRWVQDEDLKILIASHPRVPLPLAERIASGLKPPALRKLMQRPGVNPVIRSKLVNRLSRGNR